MNSAWALWELEESFNELVTQAGEIARSKFKTSAKNENKRKENITGWVLIKLLAEHFDINYQGIWKDDHNKPHLIGGKEHISITHSYPYVAAQLHLEKPVGIDLENVTDKILKLEHKFLNEQETFDARHNVVKLMVYWSAKEALYKIHGRRSLIFKEQLEIAPFELETSGVLYGSIYENRMIEKVELYYKIDDRFLMVYTL